jgi:hypothetical protein
MRGRRRRGAVPRRAAGVQCSAVQCSAVQCSAVQCSAEPSRAEPSSVAIQNRTSLVAGAAAGGGYSCPPHPFHIPARSCRRDNLVVVVVVVVVVVAFVVVVVVLPIRGQNAALHSLPYLSSRRPQQEDAVLETPNPNHTSNNDDTSLPACVAAPVSAARTACVHNACCPWWGGTVQFARS